VDSPPPSPSVAPVIIIASVLLIHLPTTGWTLGPVAAGSASI